MVVTSQTGRDRHSERQLCSVCHSQTETQKHIERDSCARCIIDRDTDTQGRTVLVVTSDTDRYTYTQR